MLHAVIPERKGVEEYVSIPFTVAFCCNQWRNFCRYC